MTWRTLAQRTGGLVRQELALLLALLVVAGGTWAFVAIAGEVLEGEHLSVDRSLLLALREAGDPHEPLGPDWLEQVAVDVTALGSYAVLGMVILAVSGFLWLAGARRHLPLLLTATLGGWMISVTIKALVDRPRPIEALHLTTVSSASFPSGHAMNAAVVYLTLGAMLAWRIRPRRLKAFVMAVALLLTLMVGVTRVYLGVHYPSDVLAGWTAGLAWAAAAWLAVELLSRWRKRAVLQDRVEAKMGER